MYPLEELFCRLANSVFRNTSLVNDDSSDIEDDHKPFVVIAANEALTRLHTRFELRSSTVLVEMQEGRTNYPLLKKYAVQSYDPKETQCPYIIDFADNPFIEDVIKIMGVFDDKHVPMVLNDRNNPNSLFTPKYNIIQNNSPKAWQVLCIEYQAKHPKLTTDEDGYNEIDLPDTLDAALDNYIAYRYYTSLNTAENTAKAAEYLSFYESICNEVVEHSSAGQSGSASERNFYIRGWR